MSLPARGAHIPHILHTSERIWTAGSSTAALWIDILHAWGFEPIAMLACTLALDFEGDQFTSFGPPIADLERLYGVTSFPLAIYDTLAAHVARQTRLGRAVLLELDAFHLPDMPALHHVRHGPTAVGVDRLDIETGSASYYRRGKRYEIYGEDFIGAFGPPHSDGEYDEALIRHIRCVKRFAAPEPAATLAQASLGLLRQHLDRVPRSSPIAMLRLILNETLDLRMFLTPAFRHSFVYGTLTQLGSNFELLGIYLDWLNQNGCAQPEGCSHACREIAAEALVCQLRLLRASSRGQVDRCEDCFDSIEMRYQGIIAALRAA